MGSCDYRKRSLRNIWRFSVRNSLQTADYMLRTTDHFTIAHCIYLQNEQIIPLSGAPVNFEPLPASVVCRWGALTGMAVGFLEGSRLDRQVRRGHIARVRFTYTRNLCAWSILFTSRVIYVCHTRGKYRLKYGLLEFFGGAVPFRTPFPTSYFSSSLPFCPCAICHSFYTSFVMGVVSAQREVPRFAGMGAVK